MNTPIANMIAEMHGKGIPVELIVSAVATFEEAMAARAVSTGQADIRPVDTSTIDKRRAWDKERKRRQRELDRLAKLSALSSGHPPDIHRNPPDDASILSSKEGAFNKENETEENKKKKVSKKDARGTRVPPDFSINDVDRKFAASIGIPPDTVEAETPQFIDYWSSVAGAKGVKLNWKATWRNRMRDLKKYQATKSNVIQARPLTEFQRSRNETKDILNDLGDYATGSGGGGQADTRLLSGDSSERSQGLRSGVGGDVIDLSAGSRRSSG